MSSSLLFSGTECLITGRVQTETEWPPVKGVAEGFLGGWETGLGDLKVLPNPRSYERATVVEH